MKKWIVHIPVMVASLIVCSSVQGQSVPAGFSDAVVVSGFSEPVGFTFDANDRLYVWEKGGKVWIVENGMKRPSPLIDISQEVGNWRDHGFLGFALDPNFLSNGHIYLFYTVDRHYLMNYGTPNYNPSANDYFSATIMRLTRYTANGPDFNSVDPSSRHILIGETKETGIPLLFESHSTGSLVFAPDGTLMLSAGDGASYNTVDIGSDPQTYYAQALDDGILRPEENVGAFRSQLLNSMNGKLMRIDPATGDGVPSNPFFNAAEPRSPRSRVWALGLRNPYRFTHRPGTGSTNPADGDPGSFYLGDVGFITFEEMNVCNAKGQNFGWPMFEGMDPHTGYMAARTPNAEAPNPLYGQGGCVKPYFDFQDLLVQETRTHLTSLPNPCDPGQPVPFYIPVFSHTRPVIDWRHGNQSRCSAFDGSTPVSYDLDAPASPVPGPRFGGSASVGAAFISGVGWPQGYQGTYFIADYASAWIKQVVMTPDDKAVQVSNFGTNMGAVVCIKEGPDSALWYVRYETGQIRKVSPIGYTNLPPVAVATQDVLYGPGPLTVQFTGSGSTDPENGPLTYQWNFGDGGTSTAANPTHVFTAPAGQPVAYTVTLTVRDDQNQPNIASLIVNVNNTPPTVVITSFPDGQLYPVGVDTTIALHASVSDAESPAGQLTYAWQTILHHNTHSHPESVDNSPSGSTVISGVGCYGGESFHYEVLLTVTDPGGLATTVVHHLYPDCARIPPTPVIKATPMNGLAPFTSTLDGWSSVDNGTVVSYAWDFGDGTFATGPEVTKTFSEVGAYQVRLTVTDNDGLQASAVAVINAFNMDPPQCVGGTGTILRQYWTGIPGGMISSLINDPRYPNSPTGTTTPGTISIPVNFANNYGTRLRGYIIPSTTGTYSFNLTADDAGVFYLSRNADPALKEMICEVPGWTADNDYTKYPSQQSGPVQLTAGKYYYFEALHKEASGGDHLTVRWTGPGIAVLTPVGGSNVAPWQDCGPNVQVRICLEGPYDAATGLMHDDLRAKGYLPLAEPYTALGFARAGAGGETMPAGMLAVIGKNAVVDWVLVELRNKTNPAQIVATRAALLQRDGDVVGTDGRSKLIFTVSADDYYVAIRHRNHLAAMSQSAVPVTKDGASLDFTRASQRTYGTEARKDMPLSREALWTGNVVRDGILKYTGANNDRDPLLQQVGGMAPTNTVSGYHVEDVNLDGVVRYTGSRNDREPILLNIGGNNAVDTRLEQLP